MSQEPKNIWSDKNNLETTFNSQRRPFLFSLQCFMTSYGEPAVTETGVSTLTLFGLGFCQPEKTWVGQNFGSDEDET